MRNLYVQDLSTAAIEDVRLQVAMMGCVDGLAPQLKQRLARWPYDFVRQVLKKLALPRGKPRTDNYTECLDKVVHGF